MQAQDSLDGHPASDPSPNPSPRKRGKSPAGKTAPKPKKERIARPMNSFMIFAREFRAEMRDKYPDIDNKDISKMLGKEWKNLSEERKKVYYDKAAVVAEQHRRDHPDWKFVRAPPRKGKGKKGDSAEVVRKPKTVPAPANNSVAAGGRGSPSEPGGMDVGGSFEDVKPGHLESLRNLQVEQSKLMLEQEEIEIARLMAAQPPTMPPPSYVDPPPLREIRDVVVMSSAEQLAMMTQHAPSAVVKPTVHPHPYGLGVATSPYAAGPYSSDAAVRTTIST